MTDKKEAADVLKRCRLQDEEDLQEIVQAHFPTKKAHITLPPLIEIDVDEPSQPCYSDIEECPTIQLMNSDMKRDPIEFFMKLEQLYE